MKKLIFFFFLLFAHGHFFAQTRNMKELSMTSYTTFKDHQGNRISFEEFQRLTSGIGYKIEPTRIEGNEILEMSIITPSIKPEPQPAASVASVSSSSSLSDAPAFATKDISGKYYDLAQLRGKVVVLKFWFVACAPCIKEIPQLNDLVDKYRSRSDVVFLAPCLDDLDKIVSLLNRQHFSYNIVANARSFSDAYYVVGYPTHIVIGKDGRIKKTITGVNASIDHLLDQAIQQELQGVDDEVESISSSDIIKDERGNLLNYQSFIELAQSGLYTPVRRHTREGQPYILMKKTR